MANKRLHANNPIGITTHRLGPRRLTKSAKRAKGRPITGETGIVDDIEKTIGNSGGSSPTLEAEHGIIVPRRMRRRGIRVPGHAPLPPKEPNYRFPVR